MYALPIRTDWHRGAALSFRLYTHYPCRGGYSANGTICGVFSISVDHIITWIYWLVGAALYIHIMLFVLVFLTVVPFGEYSLLVLTIQLPLLAGAMVLL